MPSASAGRLGRTPRALLVIGVLAVDGFGHTEESLQTALGGDRRCVNDVITAAVRMYGGGRWSPLHIYK